MKTKNVRLWPLFIFLKHLYIRIVCSVCDFCFAIFRRKRNQQCEEKTLLLLRLDSIGDYILFRNFIEVLRDSKRFLNYRITLVGRVDWMQLAEELDARFIDKFIWINIRKFMTNPVYRFSKLSEITVTGYEVLIQPTFSRSYFREDSIVKFVQAGQKIGVQGDLTNLRRKQKMISDCFYTRLIAVSKQEMFEFERNRDFFEELLQRKINLNKPEFGYVPLVSPLLHSVNYAVLFIGGSHKSKRWHYRNFAVIGKYLKEKFGYRIVICGGAGDIVSADAFMLEFGTDAVNLVGKTSLLELAGILGNASLLLSNETSAVHFAVALNTPHIFVLYNGVHPGRFAPYPAEIAKNYHVLCPFEVIDERHKLQDDSNVKCCDINDISVSFVQGKMAAVLEQK